MAYLNEIPKTEKGILALLFVVLLFVAVLTTYHSMTTDYNNKVTGNVALEQSSGEDVYDLFICQCCGESIDTGCCEMSNQGKKYLDKLLSEGLSEEEIISKMVKKYGFDVLSKPELGQVAKKYIRSKNAGSSPELEIKDDVYSFGKISQSDGPVSTTFNLENPGDADLVIEGLDTSCMCTTAFLRFEGIDGPTFGMSMHGRNPDDFELRIPPGGSAELVVNYDPMAHGIQKEPLAQIIREVTIISNDPVNFRKKVRINLVQTP